MSKSIKSTLAVDVLRTYAKFLDDDAENLMQEMVSLLRQFYNPQSMRLQRRLQTILDRHPAHSIEIHATIAEYESPKLNRVDTKETERRRFVVTEVETDPKRDAEFAEWRRQKYLVQANLSDELKPIEPDEITKA